MHSIESRERALQDRIFLRCFANKSLVSEALDSLVSCSSLQICAFCGIRSVISRERVLQNRVLLCFLATKAAIADTLDSLRGCGSPQGRTFRGSNFYRITRKRNAKRHFWNTFTYYSLRYRHSLFTLDLQLASNSHILWPRCHKIPRRLKAKYNFRALLPAMAPIADALHSLEGYSPRAFRILRCVHAVESRGNATRSTNFWTLCHC